MLNNIIGYIINRNKHNISKHNLIVTLNTSGKNSITPLVLTLMFLILANISNIRTLTFNI
nr:MAG TPA: hypothetical protein [Caudoviricetes sp.]